MIDEKEGSLKSFIEAFQVKRGAKEFYLSVSEKVSGNDLKKLFLLLSDDEQKHMDFILYLYQSIRAESSIKTFQEFKETGSFDDKGHIPEELLQSGTEDHEIKSDLDAVSMAVSMEAKAFNAFQKLSQNATDKNTRVVLSDIAEQEKKHIKQLKSMKLISKIVHRRKDEGC